jgi:hypothetical protein
MKDKASDLAYEKLCHKEIIVCLCDGRYNLGAAALINSLVKADFKGLIYIGYRGALPTWVQQFELLGENHFYITKDILVRLKQVDTQIHLGYYKPYFIKEAFDFYKNTDRFYYFDVDIVVKAPWFFFSNWLVNGYCVCLDSSFHFLHRNHPWRKQWKHWAPAGQVKFNEIDYYFNSGFLGIERKSIALVDIWIYLTKKHKEFGGNLKRFEKEAHKHLKSDQDLLNAAITISPDIEISIIGKEGMGFTDPSTLMEHAIGSVKPWNNGFCKQLIRSGQKPNSADKSFFTNCKHPINVFHNFTYKVKKIDMFTASFFGRILG